MNTARCSTSGATAGVTLWWRRWCFLYGAVATSTRAVNCTSGVDWYCLDGYPSTTRWTTIRVRHVALKLLLWLWCRRWLVCDWITHPATIDQVPRNLAGWWRRFFLGRWSNIHRRIHLGWATIRTSSIVDFRWWVSSHFAWLNVFVDLETC